ncbi:MAG: long-chain fatty acid--CoA ligase, partial [Rhizobiales bacterium]|nr:long-chain fatty acid--CoA ligase [Hyphomicrobiales bacterium]
LKDGYAPDIAALRAHCAGELADYAVPRKWRFVDALPKNPMGKVLKNELRQMADAPAQ